MGKGTRGSEEEWRQERSWRGGVGATGGSGDCQNKEKKGKKRAILSHHPITLGIMGEDGTLKDLAETTDSPEEAYRMEDPQGVDHQEDHLEDITIIILETQDSNRMMGSNLKRKSKYRKYLNGTVTLTKSSNGWMT